MSKKNIFISVIFLIMCNINVKAQENKLTISEISNRATAFYTLAWGLGADYELAISSKSSLLGRVSLNPLYAPNIATRIFDGSTHKEDGYSHLPLYVSAEYRYYTNLQRREEKDKSIDNNSGNYIALRGRYNTDGLIKKDPENALLTRPNRKMASVGLVYGLQRSFSENWGYSFNTGLFLMIPGDKQTIRHFFKNEYSNTAIWPGVDLGIHYTIK